MFPTPRGERHVRSGGRSTIAMLSTFPPTPCGIATFAAALQGSLERLGFAVHAVELAEDARRDGTAPVALSERRDQIAALNAADLALIQHEYGIYDGTDGEVVLDIVAALTHPPIVVAHTVRQSPTSHQREVLEALAAAAAQVVVMSDFAQRCLLETYTVDPTKVVVIPHGAADLVARPHLPRATDALLTWGLLGPGKGIEWAIDALSILQRRGEVVPDYLVAGRTHPKVLARSGEAYRRSLEDRVASAGLTAAVRFDPTYRDVAGLAELLDAASMVVLPYDSTDQVTSGVLVDAVAAGVPVLATTFPHAVELLSSGAGVLVEPKRPDAIADALSTIAAHPERLASMAEVALALGPDLRWDAVAARYGQLATEVVGARSLVSR